MFLVPTLGFLSSVGQGMKFILLMNQVALGLCLEPTVGTLIGTGLSGMIPGGGGADDCPG